MKKTNTAAATTTTPANVWNFDPKSITVNGRTFDAGYSIARSGDVYVFATVKTDANDKNGMPVRLHIAKTMPEYPAALAAANVAKAPKAEPAPAEVAPAADPTPAVEAAPVEAAPAAEAVQDAPKAEPVAPAKAAPVEKPWIGTAITGKGWKIAFDAEAQRTRVQFEGTPSDAQRAAVEAAGFYFSAQLQSWNKKLTCKAFRAANDLAVTLAALA